MPWPPSFGYALFWMLFIFSIWCLRYFSWGDPHSFLIHFRRFDSSHSLHDPNTCVHHMLPMNKHAIDVPYTCILNLCPHRVIHNNYSFMMDDMFLYHASNFFERCLSCANSHVHIHIMMDDVYIYHAHNFFGLCLFCVGTHEYLSTSQSHELAKRALESNWGSPGLGGVRTAGLSSSAGLQDYEDTRLKTPSCVRMGLSLAWKASLAIRICRSPTIVTDSV